MAESKQTKEAAGPPEQPGKQKKLSLRRAFFTGLAALMPTGLTLIFFVWIIEFINDRITGPINDLIIWIMGLAGVEHAEAVFKHQEIDKVQYGIIDFSFVGFVAAVAIIFIVGLALLSFVGRKLYALGERLVSNLPIMKMVYPHVKQLTQFIFSEKKTSIFGRVVALEYPRQGVWSLGFITGPGLPGLSEHAGKEIVTVFVPSSPTPFTGYVVSVPRQDIIEVPISADKALRFIMSGGVLTPGKPEAADGPAAQPPPGGSSADAPRA